MKKVTILGSTGSIGSQTLDIIRDNPDRFCVHVLTCGARVELLAEQIRTFHPAAVAIRSPRGAEVIAEQFPDLPVYSGEEGIVEAALLEGSDLVVNALVGMAGLRPTYEVLKKGRTVALANKETLVAGGKLIMKTAAEEGVPILPVDSEHSAVFQSMMGYRRDQVRRIILTASGGPFRGRTRKELEQVRPDQALKHPNWSMGQKITIDSATMMNKGFEVIEAKWLFDLPPSSIDVVVHPESVIHSMVEYEDRAVMAQLGTPDMKIPISFAMEYPDRLPNRMNPLDLCACGSLTFEEPDYDVFGCLKLAYEALEQGGTYCTALNASNEVMVEAFLSGQAGFQDIERVNRRVVEEHHSRQDDRLEDILQADRDAREQAQKILQSLQ